MPSRGVSRRNKFETPLSLLRFCGAIVVVWVVVAVLVCVLSQEYSHIA